MISICLHLFLQKLQTGRFDIPHITKKKEQPYWLFLWPSCFFFLYITSEKESDAISSKPAQWVGVWRNSEISKQSQVTTQTKFQTN